LATDPKDDDSTIIPKRQSGVVEVLPPSADRPLLYEPDQPRASKLAFVNRWSRQRIDAATSLVRSWVGLQEARIDHSRVEDRLRNVDDEIAIDRAERSLKLQGLGSKLQEGEIEHQIQEKKLRRQLEELERQERARRQPPATSKGKSPAERILELRKALASEQEKLREAGITEESEERKLLENRYNDDVRKALGQ